LLHELATLAENSTVDILISDTVSGGTTECKML